MAWGAKTRPVVCGEGSWLTRWLCWGVAVSEEEERVRSCLAVLAREAQEARAWLRQRHLSSSTAWASCCWADGQQQQQQARRGPRRWTVGVEFIRCLCVGEEDEGIVIRR